MNNDNTRWFKKDIRVNQKLPEILGLSGNPAIPIIIANVVSAPETAISLNTHDWSSPARYGETIKYSDIRPAIIELMNGGWISEEKGFINHSTGQSRMTRLSAKEEIIAVDKCLREIETILPKEKIHLNRKCNDFTKLADYKDTKKTAKRRQLIEDVNKLYASANIFFPAQKIEPVIVEKYVTYSEKNTDYFVRHKELGGRFYSVGKDCFQNLSSEQRLLITIDNAPVVELDFASLHPALLYAMEGIQIDVEPYACSFPRPLAKVILLTAFSAKSETAAIRAVWSNREKIESKSGFKVESYGQVKAAFKAVQVHNSPIAKYFGSGIGVRLQYMDSEITANILEKSLEEKIVCLPVHDSYIVAAAKKQWLYDIMQSAYRQVCSDYFGKEYECKIK